MTKKEAPSITVGSIAFYDTPSEIEGSPYWVDLWASVNGYRIGLQVKPQTYRAASISIYTGKARASQSRGHALFTQVFSGKVIITTPLHGKVDSKTSEQIIQEVRRLESLPKGPYPSLPNPDSQSG